MLENLTADDLWPHVHDARTLNAMCRILNDLGVLGLHHSVRWPVGWELCERLGFTPTRGSFVMQMTPGHHKGARTDKNRVAQVARQATPEGQEKRAKWWDDNPGYSGEYRRNRKAEDPLFALTQALRGSHRRLLRALDGLKDEQSLTLTFPDGQVETFTHAQLAGCSVEHFRDHIQSLFEPGMNWANRGEWHYDHIIPVATLGENPTREQVLIVSHWKNWQPLWAAENYAKSSMHNGKRHRLR